SVWEFYAPLLVGAQLVMARAGAHQESAALVREMEEQGVTVVQVVPAMLRMMVEEEGLARCARLRRVMCGGEALEGELVRRCEERLTEVEVYNLYGPTEATIDATYRRCEREEETRRVLAIGRPIANTQVYILDEEMGIVAVGVAGELCIGGAGLARGYLRRAEQTAEKFIPHPYSEEGGARLYRTGDKAKYLPNGEIEYLGRIDQQVKVRGYRIELGEIEAVINERTEVRESVVIVREDAPGDKRIAAYLIIDRDAQAPTPADLHNSLKERLPNYMLPSAFVMLDALPLTPNGKVDRRALPAPEEAQSESELVAPRTPFEEILSGIWASVLGLKQVSIDDDFFELGGHSLLATQLISRVREAFQVEIPLRSLFESPTISGLAVQVEKAFSDGRISESAPPIRAAREGELALSFAQQRLWFLDQLDPGSIAYNCPGAVRLIGPLNVEALKRSISEIIRRHEVLRATFEAVNGEPRQVVWTAQHLKLPLVDLSHLAVDEREAEARRLTMEEAQRPFDLSCGPLLRVSLLRLDEEDHELLVMMHHIVSDGWSLGLFIRETAALYEAFSQGQPSPLPELAIQYADYAAWQKDWLRGERLEGQLAYWKEHLAGAPPAFALPTDKKRTAEQSFRGAHETLMLGEHLSEQVKELSRKQGATLFMTLLAAFQTLLYRYTGQHDMVLGTVIANRNRVEIEDLIGFFVNTLVLRTELSGDPTFRELLGRVRDVTLGAYAHQDLPFEKLVSELQLQRGADGSPVIPVGIALQNMPLEPLALSGLLIEPVEIDITTSKTDLAMILTDTPEGLQAEVEFSTDLFETATVRRLLENYQSLLEQIVADPALRLSATRLAHDTPALSQENAPDEQVAPKERTNLTENQLLFWMAQKLQPELPTFNVAAQLITDCPVEVETLRRAFQTLVNSTDALRTVIDEIDGLPQQRVLDEMPYRLEYFDFSIYAEPEREYRTWAAKRSQVCFNFAERLFDSALVKLSDESFAWFLNQHQIVADGITSCLIYNYGAELYERALEGRLAERVDMPAFADYVRHERQARRSARNLKAEAYWKEKLAEQPEPITFYGKSSSGLTTRVERVVHHLSAERTGKLRRLAAQTELFARSPDASMFSIFAAVFLAYLHRVSGQRTILLGTPFHNRSKKFKETVGLFMQVLPLRIDIEETDTLLSLSRKATTETFETMKHGQHSVGNPFNRRNYEVVLNYLTATCSTFHGKQIKPDSGWIHSGYGNESLTVQVHDFYESGALGVDFDFDCELFSPEDRVRAIQHFERVLDAFLEDHNQPLANIKLLTADEEQRLLLDFNQTAVDVPLAQTFSQLFEAQVERTPDHVAVACDGRTLTYRELNSQANRLAHQLAQRGVGADVVVGLLAERGIDLLAAILAVFKAGGAYLPLDPSHPALRLRQTLVRSKTRLVLVVERFKAHLDEALEEVNIEDRAKSMTLDGALRPSEGQPTGFQQQAWPNLPPRSTPRNLAYVIYTSGSTGQPKGAMLEHRGMINHLYAKLNDLELSASDTVAQTASQCFDISVWQYLAALLAGGRTLIVGDEVAHDATRLMETVGRERVTILEVVPSLLRAMLETLNGQAGIDSLNGGDKPLRELRWLMATGEALAPELCRQWLRRYPHAPLMNAYGPTECSDDVTHYVLAQSPDDETLRVPIGRPVCNTQLYVTDERMEAVPQGVIGELCVGGIGVGRGYLLDPHRTAERFIPDPFATLAGARLYRTGDLVRYLPT
ncbi:MAG: amino acid adenylation domain-containing protein, partial [Pyrinomonadaceae bacterium]